MPRFSGPARFRPIILAVLTVAFLPAAARAADPVTYMPDGTMLVMSFNAQQFLQSPLIRDGTGLKPFFKDAVLVLEGFGLDPTKDTDRVVLAVGEQTRTGSMLILLHGRFDADKVQRRMKDRAKEKKDEVELIDEGGATIFQCRLPAARPNAKIDLPDRFHLCVLDESTIAVGIDRAAVAEALTKRPGGRKADIKPRVVDLVGRIDPKEALSFVFVPPPDLLAGWAIGGLTTMTGGVTVTDGVRTDIRIDTKDADGAKLLANFVRDGLGKVRDLLPALAVVQLGLERKDQDVIREMVDTFKVTMRPDGVVVSGAISKYLIDKIGRK
jgi:hypothetical protein